jgi:hypothetical protein
MISSQIDKIMCAPTSFAAQVHFAFASIASIKIQALFFFKFLLFR